jgi:hypothetical protein
MVAFDSRSADRSLRPGPWLRLTPESFQPLA